MRQGVKRCCGLFSNFGPGADCGIVAVPESALAFFYEASKSFGSEIRRVVASESKDPRRQLFECVRAQRDYDGLYAFKKSPGCSAEFYELYQERIRNATRQGLAVARKLAVVILADTANAKRLKDIRKPEFLRSATGRSFVRKYMVSHLSPLEYDYLFPSERHPNRVSSAGWDQIRYYLSTPHKDNRPLDIELSKTMQTTHPKIIQIAETYRHLEPRKIKGELDRLAQRKIGIRWLQDKFCRLAKEHSGWTFED